MRQKVSPPERANRRCSILPSPSHKQWKLHVPPAPDAMARACVIKKNFHARDLRDNKTLFGVFQYGLNLFARHAGKPFKKIVHCRAVFEILKQRRHRHARAFEQPRTADLSSNAFDRRTLAPIQHGHTITLNCSDGKCGKSLRTPAFEKMN